MASRPASPAGLLPPMWPRREGSGILKTIRRVQGSGGAHSVNGGAETAGRGGVESNNSNMPWNVTTGHCAFASRTADGDCGHVPFTATRGHNRTHGGERPARRRREGGPERGERPHVPFCGLRDERLFSRNARRNPAASREHVPSHNRSTQHCETLVLALQKLTPRRGRVPGKRGSRAVSRRHGRQHAPSA